MPKEEESAMDELLKLWTTEADEVAYKAEQASKELEKDKEKQEEREKGGEEVIIEFKTEGTIEGKKKCTVQ
jgi:hypothetical protein